MNLLLTGGKLLFIHSLNSGCLHFFLGVLVFVHGLLLTFEEVVQNFKVLRASEKIGALDGLVLGEGASATPKSLTLQNAII